ncbi:MAG: T9SS type A sorting domain-containing protein [Flavobacteriales bacterium]
MRALAPMILFVFAATPIHAQNLVAIDVTTDQYGSETIWQIDGIDVSFYEPGGGFLDQDVPGSYPQPTEFVDLPNGNFNLCLGDVYEDGFCCAFGQGSFTITHVASGTILFHTDTFSTNIVCMQFGVPLGRVQGTCYLDDDHDCAPGVTESVLPGQIIRVLPGPYYGFTNALGQFDMRVPYGSQSVEVVSSGLSPICPPTMQVPIVVTEIEPLAQVLLGDSSTSKLDIMATAGVGQARLGFEVSHTFQVTNASAFISGPITATVQLDTALSYTSASIGPLTVIGNTLTWELPALMPFTQHSIEVIAHVPADPGLLGQEITMVVEAYQTLQETVLSNNTYTVHNVITGSYDPNEKVVWPRDLYDLAIDSVLEYTIRFQNTGTDTAFNVVITDTLAAELDMGSFQQVATSHQAVLSFKPGRVLEWHFENILMPDSNVNEPASHGYLSFRIRPVEPVLPGTVFTNTANIFFDYNPPVITEPSVLTAEFSTGMGERSNEDMRLLPNPASDAINVVFTTSVVRDINVLAVDGRVVRMVRLDGDRMTLPINDLPDGLYLLRVTDPRGSRTMRFTKNSIRP